MNLSVAIVGLPNVGKSSLFNALLKKQVADVANYPFCTIQPNVGVVPVPDDRLAVLARVVHSKTLVPAVVEFYDIAGLVKGASKGEGLGNAFLSHIREVAAIVHVVRFFTDDTIVHVNHRIDPVDDIRTVESELILADLSTLEKQPAPRASASKEEIETYRIVRHVFASLNTGTAVRKLPLRAEEAEKIRHLNLLTAKPLFYVINISEGDLERSDATEKAVRALLSAVEPDAQFLLVCAKLEAEVVSLSASEQREYLAQYHLSQSGLDRVIATGYSVLGLTSFLTAGEKEVRAWTIAKGTDAQHAAGVIHTDFEKKFIKADVVPYETFVAAGGWAGAREEGKVHTVGKDFVIPDDSVVEFKIGT